MLRDNLVGLIKSMQTSAGVDSVALTTRKQASDDRPSCLENPRPERAESSLTKNATSPFQAEPAQYPMWSRDGHELFFETLDNHIMVAGYTVKGDSFVADKPRLWSEKQLGGSLMSFALAPDGKRIGAIMPVETAEAQKAQNHVIFLENFFDEVRRKVPVGK